ncbi:hypothetical protein NLG97_g3405 [Lecanicillium saksenae]|uniref:Uncharacterized protein n=1 Tax=Lecanicillium saksenae TaxID=468837 RepID=A0ACC1QY93_9HYPO|nr:hypothetical protein NLG97_g3405 [Lecanicillium saksenae]
MSSSWLSRLPHELLVQVAQQLPQSTRASLVGTCKDLFVRLQPILYRDITVTWAQDKPPRLASVLRTLLGNRKLAGYTKSLSFDGDFAHKGSRARIQNLDKLDSTSVSVDQVHEFLESVDMLCYDAPFAPISYLATHVYDGKAGSMVALLMALVPNIEMLHIGPMFASDMNKLGLLPNYHRLKRIVVSSHIRDERQYRNILSFFYLPNIVQLSVPGYNGPHPESVHRFLEKLPPNLENLIITLDLEDGEDYMWERDCHFGYHGAGSDTDDMMMIPYIISGLETLDRTQMPKLQTILLDWYKEEVNEEYDAAFARFKESIGIEVKWVGEAAEEGLDSLEQGSRIRVTLSQDLNATPESGWDTPSEDDDGPFGRHRQASDDSNDPRDFD